MQSGEASPAIGWHGTQRQRARIVRALAAVLSTPALLWSQATEHRFEGVAWQAPVGMEVSDQWDTSTCPARCVIYQMRRSSRTSDHWPLLLVHEPFVGTARQFRDRWVANVEARDEGVDVAFRAPTKQTTSGALRLELSAIELVKAYVRPGGVVLLLVEREGVVVPIELYDSSLERALRAVATLSDVAGTVTITPATVIATQQQASGEREQLARAMAAGYARGERARLYMNPSSGVRNTYGLSGMELRAYREERLLAFLPGGVFLTEAPASGYRTPDLPELRRNQHLGRWKAVAGGLEVTHPDGSVRVYRQVGGAAGAHRLSLDGDTWTEVPVYTPSELVGAYRTVNTFTAGGQQVGQSTMIASRSDSELSLLADGRFTMSRDSYTSVSGTSVAGGVGNRALVTGRWQFDVLAYTITLHPDDGTPVITGPFHGGPGETPSQVRTGETLNWRVLTDAMWWMAR